MWPAWKRPAHQNHHFCTASISNGVCIYLDTHHSIVFFCMSLNKTTFVVPGIFGSSRQRGVWRSGGFGSHNTGGVLKEQEFGQTNSACSVYSPANIYNVSNDSLSSTDRRNVDYWFLYAIILIDLNENNSFVKSSLEYFPRLMTQKGKTMERHGGVRDNRRMRVRFHCHDWLSKCHQFHQRRGEEMLGAAFLFYQGRRTRATFIILQGKEWKVRTGPGFDYLSPACLREGATRGRAPVTIQPWRVPRVRPGSACHSLTHVVVCWQSNRWHEITALQRPDPSLSKLISHWPTLKIQIYSHKGHRIDRQNRGRVGENTDGLCASGRTHLLFSTSFVLFQGPTVYHDVLISDAFVKIFCSSAGRNSQSI